MKITIRQLVDLSTKIEQLIYQDIPELEKMRFTFLGMPHDEGMSFHHRIGMVLNAEFTKAGVVIE